MKRMKLATRINSYLRIEGYDLEKSFSDFKKVGLGYVDLNYPEHVKGYDANTMKSLLNKYDLKLNGVALRFRNKFINGELGNSDPELIFPFCLVFMNLTNVTFLTNYPSHSDPYSQWSS